MRTVDEIRKRLSFMKEHDSLGFALDDLAIYIPELYKDPTEAPREVPSNLDEHCKEEIVQYLPFAFGKALDHRGLSANRSVLHLANWAWLMGRDDLADFALSGEHYTNYGVPILKKFAQEFGVELPDEIEKWEDGKECKPGCVSGCGT